MTVTRYQSNPYSRALYERFTAINRAELLAADIILLRNEAFISGRHKILGSETVLLIEFRL